ncbi:MAG: YbjN domain-containing protein [Crocinitomicaceae bacterium]|nr:YbjN domain-containing protein [Crocinitomicaceae bacterium]
MDINFEKVRNYLLDMHYIICHEEENTGVFVVSSEDDGINNLVIGCADPILIMEQHLFDLKKDSSEVFKALLMKNRDIVHGAFVLDESGEKVIFRDTLQIENLDRNELEGSLNSLSLLLSEYSDEIISFSKN